MNEYPPLTRLPAVGFTPPAPARPQLNPMPGMRQPWVVPRVIESAIQQSPVSGTLFLYLFIFLLVGRFCDIYLTGLHVPLLTSIAAFLCAMATGQLRFVVSAPAFKAMIGLTIWMMMGTPFSLWRGGSLDMLMDWMKSFISFIVILAMVDTVSKAARLLQVIAAAVLCTACLAVVAGDQMAGRLILRQGLYAGPNELATACVMGMIAWWFVLGSSNISGFLRLALVPFALFVAYLLPRTGSRAALITSTVTIVFLLFRFQLLTRIMILIGAMFGFAIMAFTLPPEIRVRFVSLFTQAEATTAAEGQQLQYAQGSSDERWRLLVDSLWITARYPIFGTGMGNFGVERSGNQREAGQRGSYQGTHNTYTQFSSETGIPGFLCFAASLVICWRNIRKVIRLYQPRQDRHSMMVYHTAHTLWLMLVAYLVDFCFEYVAYSPMYLVVCALITAFSHAALRDYAAAQSAEASQTSLKAQPA